MAEKIHGDIEVNTPSESQNGAVPDLSSDAIQLAALGHKEELGMLDYLEDMKL